MFGNQTVDRGAEVKAIIDVMVANNLAITEEIVLEVTKIVCNYTDTGKLMNEFMPQILDVINMAKPTVNEKEENTDAQL